MRSLFCGVFGAGWAQQQVNPIAGSFSGHQGILDGAAHLLDRGSTGRRFTRQTQQRRHGEPPQQFLVTFADQISLAFRLMYPRQPANIRIEP